MHAPQPQWPPPALACICNSASPLPLRCPPACPRKLAVPSRRELHDHCEWQAETPLVGAALRIRSSALAPVQLKAVQSSRCSASAAGGNWGMLAAWPCAASRVHRLRGVCGNTEKSNLLGRAGWPPGRRSKSPAEPLEALSLQLPPLCALEFDCQLQELCSVPSARQGAVAVRCANWRALDAIEHPCLSARPSSSGWHLMSATGVQSCRRCPKGKMWSWTW
mmetsp:Transcript_129500/g.225008  ORF Transcript_129500/g.225008 Transcript_129500/m.225008 type:complete len:221 (+) Transcript_129500:409-1071(+)